MVDLFSFNEQFSSEEDAVRYLEQMRWGDKVVCPHCSSDKVYRFSTRKIFKCGSCTKQFTVRIGTIFEDSRVPLVKWFLAIYLLTSLKKGISSIQLAKYLGVTQKTAWFILQRIRYAVSNGTFDRPLEGVVEGDEAYVGGVRKGDVGRRVQAKTIVVGLAERRGEVRMVPVADVKSKTVLELVKANVKKGSIVVTDELGVYAPVRFMGYSHQTINHSRGSFVDGLVHTNTVENMWSHLKRGISAIYIHVSKKHLGKYCDEYAFRLNTRKMTDFERFNVWLGLVGGKRLTYQKLIA